MAIWKKPLILRDSSIFYTEKPRGNRRAFHDLLTRWTSVEDDEVNEVKTVSNESLEIWRSFINLLALMGELCHTSKVCLEREKHILVRDMLGLGSVYIYILFI